MRIKQVSGSGYRAASIAAALACTSLFATRICLAASGGKAAEGVMNLDSGARALGMAGAYTAVAEDLDAAYYNPAGLSGLENFQAGFFYHRWLAGIAHSYLGAAKPLGKALGTASVGISFLGIPSTDSFDSLKQAQGSLSAGDFGLGLGYGRILAPGLSAGLSAKFLRKSLAGDSVTAAAFDLGVLYRINRHFQAGAFAGNLGTSLRFLKEAVHQQSDLRLGISGKFPEKKILGSLELSKPLGDDPLLKLGAEYALAPAFSLRSGFATEFGGRSLSGFSGLSAGFGYRRGSLRMDYAVTPWGDLGLTHIVALGFEAKANLAREISPALQVPASEPVAPEISPVVTTPAVETPAPASPLAEPAVVPTPALEVPVLAAPVTQVPTVPAAPIETPAAPASETAPPLVPEATPVQNP